MWAITPAIVTTSLAVTTAVTTAVDRPPDGVSPGYPANERPLTGITRGSPPVRESDGQGKGGRGKGCVVDNGVVVRELVLIPAPRSTREGASAANRVIVFATPSLRVEVEVLSDRLVGQIIPQSAGDLAVEGDGRLISSSAVDDLGFFVIEPVPPGRVRFRFTAPTVQFATGWVGL